MASSSTYFVPRKLTLKRQEKQNTSSSLDAATEARADGDTSTNTDPSQKLNGLSTWKKKAKSKAIESEVIEDEEACTIILWLSLSDYALWANRDLYECLEDGDEGFISFRSLHYLSKDTSGGTGGLPRDSILAQTVKSSPLFDVRMIMAEPSVNGWFVGEGIGDGGNEQGGFEIRRRDWILAKEKRRKHTSYQWDTKTVYLENIPVNRRSKKSLFALVHDLLSMFKGSQLTPLVESISFPPHRDDKVGSSEPSKCKGFAWVVLSQTKYVDFLVERWPWHPTENPLRDEDSDSQEKADALKSGFRCLTKRAWEKLKEEYLVYQNKLLEDAANSITPVFNSYSQGHITARKAETRDKDEMVPRTDSLKLTPTYPLNCLVFIKNIHSETNKTTLRHLCTSSPGVQEEQIDYVDYTKGLDTCYIRLSSSDAAKALVEHFNSKPYTQKSGLDGVADKGEDGNPIIAMELVQGRREELYWEKVPLKVRQQAMAKISTITDAINVHDYEEDEKQYYDGTKRKQKRRKHS